MAGMRPELYQRMLSEIAAQARLADDLGYDSISFTEHHFHVEGFEISGSPVLLDLFVGLQTRRDQAESALARVRAVVDEFLANGPTEGELADAKASLAGGFPLRIDSNRKLLNEWAIVGFYRLPETWLADFPRAVERVTAAEVRAAFARHVRPERFVTVVVGAAEGQ